MKLFFRPLLLCLFMMSATVSAVEISKEYFANDEIPESLKDQAWQGDLTLLTFKSWPKNGTVETHQESIVMPKKKANSFKMDSTGSFVTVIGSIGYIPGLKTTYTYIDKKNKISKKIELIPARILDVSKLDSAEIEAELLSMQPVLYRIYMRGFQKDEKLHLSSSSYDEVNEMDLNTSDPCVLLPEVVGKPGGVCKVAISRPSGEILTLALPWGIEWERYILYFDEEGNVKSLIDNPEFLKENPKSAAYFSQTGKQL